MRFNPNAYASHPILRPNSSDYPAGEFDTELTARKAGANLEMSVSFRIDEPAVRQNVLSGDAACCAYLYCRSSSFSETFRAEIGSEKLSALAPLDALNGVVEVHPFVIALNDLTLPANTANPEYGDGSISVPRLRQLAAGTTWHFSVGAIGSVESAFRLEKDPESNLKYGEFDFDINPQRRHIVIIVNPETHSRFNEGARSDEPLAMSTVYLAALTSALAYIDEKRDGDDEEAANGWAVTLRARLAENGINLDSVSIGLAAQKLLNTPLTYILGEDTQ